MFVLSLTYVAPLEQIDALRAGPFREDAVPAWK